MPACIQHQPGNENTLVHGDKVYTGAPLIEMDSALPVDCRGDNNRPDTVVWGQPPTSRVCVKLPVVSSVHIGLQTITIVVVKNF